jgi:hypothetical protein
MTVGSFDESHLPALKAASCRGPDSFCSHVCKKRRRIECPDRLSTTGPGIDAQNVAPEMASKWICDSSKAILDSIFAISGSAAAHGVTQKPVPQINHGSPQILP